jgi:hypothetical protein
MICSDLKCIWYIFSWVSHFLNEQTHLMVFRLEKYNHTGFAIEPGHSVTSAHVAQCKFPCSRLFHYDSGKLTVALLICTGNIP